MLNLLWSIVNALLILGIAYLFFRAARLVHQHMGPGTALLFVAGLAVVSCSRTGSSAPPPQNLLTNVPANAPLGNARAIQHIPLGSGNTLILVAKYRSSNGVIVPRGLFATVSGFMLGHQWEPTAGLLEQRGPYVRYQTVLYHQWRLLGTTVFISGGELFEGLMPKADAPQ